MDCISAKLIEMGVEIEEQDDNLLVRRTGALKRTNVKTLPYPGPPRICSLKSWPCCAWRKVPAWSPKAWDNRYRYVDELKRLGAHIQVDGKVAVVEGIDHFDSAPIQACDLRAGAAMVIVALAAHGTTEVSCVNYIERGYEDIVGKLRALGANIRVEEVSDDTGSVIRVG